MPRRLQEFVEESVSRWLEESAVEEIDTEELGVHVSYEDLYDGIIFLTLLYLCGQVSSRLLDLPSLVGEIICGIILGPPLLDFVPYPEAFVLLGEIGLILLVVEAGIDIDVALLKIVGGRGFLIACFGTIIPLGIAMGLISALGLAGAKGVIAAGTIFGPTSVGIALNVLRRGGILNTPVGQLIVSAAVIDDIIGLVMLSQLETLVGEITAVAIIVPIVSALGFLLIGGYLAVFVLPDLIEKYILAKFSEQYKDKVEMVLLFAGVLVMMPATYYGKVSYLVGSFIAGLTFASSHSLHATYAGQFKRITQWMMRIFFGATMGFQVPIQDFGSVSIIWHGLLFLVPILVKVAVGLLVPNFTQSRKYTNFHLRDCLTVGFSMLARGEFAFVLAVFGLESGLISKELYSSCVMAVLLSTIISPFMLRNIIAYYNKVAENLVQTVAKEETLRKHDLEDGHEAELVSGIRNQTSVFLCIQTQSESKWGLLHRLMQCMADFGLDIIDHRAWQPRGVHTTLVNEVYAKSSLDLNKGGMQEVLEKHIKELTEALEKVIGGGDTCKVKVQRWYPGVVEEIVEEVSEKSHSNFNVSQRLLNEANSALERKQMITTQATTSKTIDKIIGEMEGGAASSNELQPQRPRRSKQYSDLALAQLPEDAELPAIVEQPKPRRRVRAKMRSTPVVGGGLFGEAADAGAGTEDLSKGKRRTTKLVQMDDLLSKFSPSPVGIPAEIIVNGQSYSISLSQATWREMQRGYNSQMVDSRGIEITGMVIKASDNAPVVQRLQGFVRHGPMTKIQEESLDSESEVSNSVHGGAEKE